MTQDHSGPSRTCATRGWAIFLFLWVCFIWGHSLIPGTGSSQESGFFVSLLTPAFHVLGVTDVDLMTFIVRKTAHFSEYAVLGVGVRGLLSSMGERRPHRVAVALLATALVPCADETIQLFVSGREGSPRDVLIDLCGLAFGFAVATLVVHLASRGKARP